MRPTAEGVVWGADTLAAGLRLPRRWFRLLGAQRTPQCLSVGIAQVRAELQNGVQNSARLKVSLSTPEMHVSPGSKPPLLIKHNANAPTPLNDRFMATATLGLPSRRSFSPVNTLEPFMCHAPACRTLEPLPIRHPIRSPRKRFKERLGPLVRCA